MGPQHPMTPPRYEDQIPENREHTPQSGGVLRELERPLEIPRTLSHDSSVPGAPSSVELRSFSSWDVSEISGGSVSVYRKEHKVPSNIYPLDTHSMSSAHAKHWHHAYRLSVEPPKNPSDAPEERSSLPSVSSAKMDWNMPGLLDTAVEEPNTRLPLIILLMDPWRKSYELLQIWVDSSTDTVRDVLYSIRQLLPNQWGLDYDGLVQLRGGRSSLLINCIGIKEFEVVPNEVWLARPWKMPKDVLSKHGDTLTNHLIDIGILHSSSQDPTPRKSTVPHLDEVLTLSQEAQTRIFAPGGILRHHHACQCLSFSPPFETSTEDDPKNAGDAISVASDLASVSSIGLVRQRGTACTEEGQEVVFRMAMMQDVVEEEEEEEEEDESHETAVFRPLLGEPENELAPGTSCCIPGHDSIRMRSSRDSGRLRMRISYLRKPSLAKLVSSLRLTRKSKQRARKQPGFSRLLHVNESYDGTCALVDDDDMGWPSSTDTFTIELANDGTTSVVSASAPLLIFRSDDDAEVSEFRVTVRNGREEVLESFRH